MTTGLVDRPALVSLQRIDAFPEKALTDLSVSSGQSPYVASNKRSLDDAKSNPGSWPRAICLDQIPVGFALLFMPFFRGAIERPQVRLDQIVLWRFMIDHKFQRMGYGQQALKLIRRECMGHAGITEIMSSFVPGPHGPEKFYLSQGFTKTGRLRAGGSEIEIVLSLR